MKKSCSIFHFQIMKLFGFGFYETQISSSEKKLKMSNLVDNLGQLIHPKEL